MNEGVDPLWRRRFLFKAHFLNSSYCGLTPGERNHYKINSYLGHNHNTGVVGLLIMATSEILGVIFFLVT